MSQDFDFFWRKALWTKALAVLLSVLSGVGGCACPRACNRRRMCMQTCPLWNNPAVSASAADATTDRRVLHLTEMGAFGAGAGIDGAGDGYELRM